MNLTELEVISKKYIDDVSTTCTLLLSAYGFKNKEDFRMLRTRGQCGEFVINGDVNQFMFHGRGCRFSNKNITIDWAFGDGDIWCGLDPWHLAYYIVDNRKASSEFCNGDRIKDEFEKLVKDGKMVKKYGLYYFI